MRRPSRRRVPRLRVREGPHFRLFSPPSNSLPGMKIQQLPTNLSRPLMRPASAPPPPSEASGDHFTPVVREALKGGLCGALAGTALTLIGRAAMPELLLATAVGLLGGAAIGLATAQAVAPPQPPPQPPQSNPFGDFVDATSDAAKMLERRAENCERYLAAEVKYANFQASASIVDGPKAMIAELDSNWKTLPSRPDPGSFSPPDDPRQLSRQLRDLQADLMKSRSRSQQVIEDSRHVRDGFYSCSGPREAGQKLLSDVQAELARVESALKRLPQPPVQ